MGDTIELPAAPVTVTLDRGALIVVLDALHDKLFEVNRYVNSSEVSPKPEPLDSCCPGHLARYAQRAENHRALMAHLDAVQATLEVFETAV